MGGVGLEQGALRWGREGLGLRKEGWNGHVALGIFVCLAAKRITALGFYF